MSQPASSAVEVSQETFNSIPLPKGWRKVRLGDLCQVVRGSSPRPKGDPRFFGGSIPWVLISDLSKARGRFLYKTAEGVTELGREHSRYVEAGSLIVSNSATIGKPIFMGVGGCIHDGFLTFLNVNTDLSLDWLYEFFQFVRTHLERIAPQGAQKNLNTGIVERLEIPLPPLLEQERITTILKEQNAAMERARTAAEAQLKAAKDLPAAYLRSVFDGAEAQGWQFVKVGDISSLIIDGPHVTPMYVPKGVPFVTVKNIVNRRVDLAQVSYITEDDHAEFTRRGKAEKGDILYTKDGTLGIPCVVDTDKDFSFFVSVALIKLVRERADSRFVAYALESPLVLKQVELLGAGAGLKHMVLRSIRALEIPLPSMSEQRKIAAALDERMLMAEQTKKILQDQLDSINKLPAALLRQAFTGKL